MTNILRIRLVVFAFRAAFLQVYEVFGVIFKQSIYYPDNNPEKCLCWERSTLARCVLPYTVCTEIFRHIFYIVVP